MNNQVDSEGCIQQNVQELDVDEVREPVELIQKKHKVGSDVRPARPYVCGIKMSPKLICGIMFVYAIFCGPCYVNFNPLRDVFLRDNAYAWKCAEYDPSNPPIPNGKETPVAICKEQELALSFLFTICSSSHFFFSAAGGVMVDRFGPKITGITGISFMLIAWLLIAFSTQSFQAYVPGFIFIGIGVDAAFFGAFSILSLFPGYENGILGVFGATRSLSFAIPLLIKAVAYSGPYEGMRRGVCSTIVIMMLICLITAAFIFPMDKWRPTKRRINVKQKVAALKKTFSKNSATPEKQSSSATTPDCSSVSFEKTHVAIEDDDVQESTFCQNIDPIDNISVYEVFFSKLFVPLVIYFVVYVTVTVFFTPSADVILEDVYEIHQYLTIFSFLPAPFLGYIADKTDIVYVMYLLNVNLALIYVFGQLPSIPAPVACQLLSSICFSCSLSFKISQIYCYASSHLPPQHIGKLCGTLTALGGAVTFMNSPLQSFARNNNQYRLMMLLILFIILLMFFPLIYLKRQVDARIARKEKSAQLQGQDATLQEQNIQMVTV